MIALAQAAEFQAEEIFESHTEEVPARLSFTSVDEISQIKSWFHIWAIFYNLQVKFPINSNLKKKIHLKYFRVLTPNYYLVYWYSIMDDISYFILFYFVIFWTLLICIEKPILSPFLNLPLTLDLCFFPTDFQSYSHVYFDIFF